MQAATQINYPQINSPYLSLQGNMNALFGGGAQPQLSRGAGSNGSRNPSGQMSNMLSGFSTASFSVFSQSTGNGQSSTFFAQGTISNRGQSANQQPASWGRNDNHGDRSGSTSGNRCNDNSRGGDRTPPRNDCGCKGSGGSDQTQWSNTTVSNNKASIDLGNYKLDFNKADSSIVMTNTKSGDTTKIWGDPHLTQHANGANSSTAMFNGPMTFMLPDNTKVTVGTQPAANNKSVSFADQVTITHGNQAYQVAGLSEQNKAGLDIQKSSNGRALDAATPDGYTVQAARDGSGWINPATGKELTADDIRKANT
ncbi:DUF1521 domain-containing protein [Paraburkholderia fungorum]|uniref:DUF1521 domain-containing protein n=1 Tax=Paraburkholderia fungorum TaxID=134537 RepID=UPI0038B7477C